MNNSIVQASNIEIDSLDGVLVVDSRLIANQLGIEHRSFFRTIKKYETRIEQRFGVVRFNFTPCDNAGHAEKYALLTENQSMALMTFSKNTDEVVECKLNLVDAFDKAKQVIKTVIPAQNDRLRELELENENLKLKTNLVNITDTLVTMHGEALGLTIAGLNVGQIIEVKIPTTEVLNPVTGSSVEFLDAKQLATEVQRRSGQKVKSNADFVRKVKAANRDDLIVPVTRNATCEYIKPDDLDEAIELVYGRCKQQLLTPTQSAIV